MTRPQSYLLYPLPYPLYALFSPIAFMCSNQLSDDALYLQHEAVRWRSSMSPPQKNGIPPSAKYCLESYLPLSNNLYRVVQLSFTPEIEVFYMVFERSIFIMTSLKKHMEYFHFRCKIQLDLPVHILAFMFTIICPIKINTGVIKGSTSCTNRDRQGIKLRQAIWDRVRCWIEW